jgi:hypothetical protein
VAGFLAIAFPPEFVYKDASHRVSHQRAKPEWGEKVSLAAQRPAGNLFTCTVAALFVVMTPLVLRAEDLKARAQAPAASFRPAPALPYWTNRGRWNLGAQVGYSMEYGMNRGEISHIQLLIAQPQLGLIVRDFRVRLFPVQRFEIINEGILGGAVHPRASLLGVALLFRFDGKPRGHWVPFLDAGAGVQRTSLSDHVPEVNGHTEFSPQGGLGVQYFIRPQRAIVFEWRTMHMSNAGITPPNHGFNASMLTIGFRWLRRPR